MITLATLETATTQEVFDQAVRHLLTQMAKSQSGSLGYCVYRNSEGLKCAAGCFISDSEYNTDFERQDWNRLVDTSQVPDFHQFLIADLQKIHDECLPEQWFFELKELANIHDFEFNPPINQ